MIFGKYFLLPMSWQVQTGLCQSCAISNVFINIQLRYRRRNLLQYLNISVLYNRPPNPQPSQLITPQTPRYLPPPPKPVILPLKLEGPRSTSTCRSLRGNWFVSLSARVFVRLHLLHAACYCQNILLLHFRFRSSSLSLSTPFDKTTVPLLSLRLFSVLLLEIAVAVSPLAFEANFLTLFQYNYFQFPRLLNKYPPRQKLNARNRPLFYRYNCL
jgi:hypothetical protein